MPGARCRNQVPPTSGKKPMRVSGIATRVRGPAMRRLAPWARPMPPPIAMPSITATTGFGIGVDAVVERVLDLEEVAMAIAAPATNMLAQLADVAARAERLSPGAAQHDDAHALVAFPVVQPRGRGPRASRA